LSAIPEEKSEKVSKCGIVETPLIVGGQRVNENEFPHMVSSIMVSLMISMCFGLCLVGWF
jgi:hypothetical protein